MSSESKHHLTHYSGSISPKVESTTQYRLYVVQVGGEAVPGSPWFDTYEDAEERYNAHMSDWHKMAQAGWDMENGRHLQIRRRTVDTTVLRGCIVSEGR